MEAESDDPHSNEQSTNLLEDSSAKLPELPYDIIVSILLKLHVKPLMRFRCVSMSWRSLISDPTFVKKHLHISTTEDKDNYNARLKILLTSTDPDYCFRSCSLNSIYNEPSSDAIELHQPMKDCHRRDRLIGSCNGLLCIAINNITLFLWNPTIRESRRLPHSGLPLEQACDITYGFGYDSSTDDYKVVAVLSRFGGRKPTEKMVKVYSLRTDSWRRIGDFPYGPHNEQGLFVGGALNWPAVRFDGTYVRFNEHVLPVPGLDLSWNVLGLDLASETYKEVPQPEYEDDGHYDRALGRLGGCLCLLANYRGKRADVWVMKEYGVKELWTKFATIPYLIDLWYSEHYPFYGPLHLENDELVLDFKSFVILYNIKDKTFRSPVIYNLQACLKSSIYVESLVSPNARNMIERIHQGLSNVKECRKG